MKIDFDHWMGSQLGDTAMNNLEEERRLKIIKNLNPKFTKDGNKYCFLYGELPNNCVIGFGDTAYEAMNDFCNNFYTRKAVK